MKKIFPEKDIRRIFQISILMKAIDALFEIIGGIMVVFTSRITGWVAYLIQRELLEDPKDFIANFFRSNLPHLSENQRYFIVFYLLSHGLIKLFLAGGLLRNKLWAYPSAIIVFILFVLYQIYRYSYTQSVYLILLTIFDIIVIALTWHEYKIVRRAALK